MGLQTLISENPVFKAIGRILTWGSIIIVVAMAIILVINPEQFFGYVDSIVSTIVNGVNYIVNGVVGVVQRFLDGLQYYAFYIATELGKLVRNVISSVSSIISDLLAQVDPRNWDIDWNPL